ncbi:MAG: hypothetical protein QXR73_02170 [Candidatus Micrarchaeaceae archaeon]
MAAQKRHITRHGKLKARYFKKKPKLGASLLVIAGIIAIVVSIIIGISAFSNEPVFAIVDSGAGAIIGVAIIAASINAYTNDTKKSETWAIIALILYLVEIPSLWGFGIGFIIALAGTIITLKN